MTDLGTLGGMIYSEATGINNNGQAIGNSYTAGGVEHAFLYSNGAITDLGTLGGSSSVADGINNNGQVVGTALTSYGSYAAFLYSNGKMVDLNTLIAPESGWGLNQAFGINDSGQIVGMGTINGQTRAFLLSPVPLPASAWLMLSGLGSLGAMARKRKAG